MRRLKQPTATSIVFEALVRADDFRTGLQLQAETGLNSNRVSAALYHLKKYKAAEFIEGEGNLWWFATPETDTRSRTIEEKAPELKPRKPRKTRRKHEVK